ncbi:hypothetical protein V6N00_12520 [Tersicoccus sp. MR15.9]|uniref:hypothetical protein n=1 Tax=Tersicoccus mangrovi TaxID=3121635 RepID=UPI002FE6A819
MSDTNVPTGAQPLLTSAARAQAMTAIESAVKPWSTSTDIIPILHGPMARITAAAVSAVAPVIAAAALHAAADGIRRADRSPGSDAQRIADQLDRNAEAIEATAAALASTGVGS